MRTSRNSAMTPEILGKHLKKYINTKRQSYSKETVTIKDAERPWLASNVTCNHAKKNQKPSCRIVIKQYLEKRLFIAFPFIQIFKFFYDMKKKRVLSRSTNKITYRNIASSSMKFLTKD